MRTTKEQLIRQLEPGDKVRWSAENDSIQTDPCTVNSVCLEGKTAKVNLSGPRTGEYEIRLEENGKIVVFSVHYEEDRYGELKWISIVAGEKFRQ